MHRARRLRDRTAVNLSAVNLDRSGIRIESGNRVRVRLEVKNRGEVDAAMSITSTLGELLILDDKPVQIPGTPRGDIPKFVSFEEDVTVLTSESEDTPHGGLVVVLEPGRHPVRADVADEVSGEVVAHASVTLWIESEPDDGGPDLPYTR